MPIHQIGKHKVQVKHLCLNGKERRVDIVIFDQQGTVVYHNVGISPQFVDQHELASLIPDPRVVCVEDLVHVMADIQMRDPTQPTANERPDPAICRTRRLLRNTTRGERLVPPPVECKTPMLIEDSLLCNNRAAPTFEKPEPGSETATKGITELTANIIRTKLPLAAQAHRPSAFKYH
jgi:hypothetical protein